MFSEHIRHLIESREVIHNEDLNIDYVVLDVFTMENFAENCLELRVIVDILEDNRDKEFYNQLNTLYDSLGELLPTKRPEKFAGEEW